MIETDGNPQTAHGAAITPAALDWTAASVDRTQAPAVLGIGPQALGGRILPVGEVGILAGAGGGGKSRLALQIAIAAASGEDGALVPVFRRGHARMDDLTVRGGPVVMLGYEDADAEVRYRVKKIARYLTAEPAGVIDNPLRLSVAVAEVPLWAPPAAGDGYDPAAPTGVWRALWDRVRALKGVRMVVVDPIALAFDSGRDGYPTAPVGAFVGALRREARAAHVGVLLIHHVPKGAANRLRDPDVEPDQSDVAGSHAWVDRSRSALFLRPAAAERGRASLWTVKANYAAMGELAKLRAVEPAGAWEIDDGEATDDALAESPPARA